jgi:DeoR family transcriptional regulator, fructose operon transcriptional repressor
VPSNQDAFTSERHQRILERAITHGVARTRDLAAEFGVHEMTVRRDMDALVEQGLLERVHGGGRIMQEASQEVAYSLRAARQITEKTRIARAALALIQDGETIAIDSSTTGLALVKMLAAKRVQAIVTGLDAANALVQTGVPFTLMGGSYHAPARSFVGSVFSAGLKRFNPDRVFFSSKGFTLRHGFTDAHLPEVEAKEQLIAAAAQKVALLDHTKFGVRAAHTILETKNVDALITDAAPSSEFRASLKRLSVKLIVTRRTHD